MIELSKIRVFARFIARFYGVGHKKLASLRSNERFGPWSFFDFRADLNKFSRNEPDQPIVD